MALKVKAVERLVKFSKEDAGTYRYVMTPELYIALNQAKVIREAAIRRMARAILTAMGAVSYIGYNPGYSVSA